MLLVWATTIVLVAGARDVTASMPLPKNTPEHRRIPTGCRLVPSCGSCREQMTRYFFNLTSQTCQAFSYTGCNGNANNFITEAACLSSCMCAQPLQTGTCSSRTDRGRLRTYFDASTGVCRQLTSRRCQTNSNVFPAITQCLGTCSLCALAVDVGPCNANFSRYHYNKVSKQCEEFTYGGCGGNANRFHTMEQCYRTCRRQKPTSAVETRAVLRKQFPRLSVHRNQSRLNTNSSKEIIESSLGDSETPSSRNRSRTVPVNREGEDISKGDRTGEDTGVRVDRTDSRRERARSVAFRQTGQTVYRFWLRIPTKTYSDP